MVGAGDGTCSYNFQHPHISSQLSITPVLGNSIPSLTLASGMQVESKDTLKQNTHIHKIKISKMYKNL